MGNGRQIFPPSLTGLIGLLAKVPATEAEVVGESLSSLAGLDGRLDSQLAYSARGPPTLNICASTANSEEPQFVSVKPEYNTHFTS